MRFSEWRFQAGNLRKLSCNDARTRACRWLALPAMSERVSLQSAQSSAGPANRGCRAERFSADIGARPSDSAGRMVGRNVSIIARNEPRDTECCVEFNSRLGAHGETSLSALWSIKQNPSRREMRQIKGGAMKKNRKFICRFHFAAWQTYRSICFSGRRPAPACVCAVRQAARSRG